MKWAVTFPEESILLVRPCLVALCHGNRPAAKLLSVLIYRYSLRLEHKSDAENINEVKAANGETADQDTTFRIYRKQSQLVTDMCDEITEKTLHDVAVPTLQLFGYLDVDESPAIHCYDLHMDVVVAALEAYKCGTQQLEDFLIAHVHIQLEKFLINKKKFQLDKKKFLLPLEEVLIANRNFSNNKRGRKPRREAAGEPQSEEPQIDSDCLEIDSEIGNESNGAFSDEKDAPTSEELLEDVIETHDEVKEELHRISGEHPAVKPTDTESHYPIADSYSAIGKVIPPVLSLPDRGAHTHGSKPLVPPGHSNRHNPGPDPAGSLDEEITHERNRHRSPADLLRDSDNGATGTALGDSVVRQQEITEHAPGTPAPLPSVGTPPGTSRHGDAGSVQAHSSGVPEPAQPPPPLSAPASGRIPRRPRGKPAVLELSLMGMDVKRWLEEIRGVKVRMTANNVKACNALAECDGVSLQSLKAYFEHVDEKKWDVDLLTAAGETGNDKTQFLSFESNWPKLKKKLNGHNEKPPDKYTAASRDKERLERGLQRLRDLTIAEGRGGELPK